MSQTLEVKIFASVREILGRDSIEVEVTGPLTGAELLAKLGTQFPDIADKMGICRLAVDMKFTGKGDTIDPATAGEVALIPPVSGG